MYWNTVNNLSINNTQQDIVIVYPKENWNALL